MALSKDRKKEERDFHDAVRNPEAPVPQANGKFYSVDAASQAYMKNMIRQYCVNGLALDYGCGNGVTSIYMAKAGANVIGIELSEVSLNNARLAAASAGVDGRTEFLKMDAESMTFPDDHFDLIVINGVLHHLDIDRAFPELSRVLKPDGHVLAAEALGHNPIIQWYRRRTPHLRTAWETEHIIKRDHLDRAGQYFGDVRWKFFHLAVLGAIPFRNMPGFGMLRRSLDLLDEVLLSLPALRWQAWQVVIEFSQPTKRTQEAKPPDPTGAPKLP